LAALRLLRLLLLNTLGLLWLSLGTLLPLLPWLGLLGILLRLLFLPLWLGLLRTLLRLLPLLLLLGLGLLSALLRLLLLLLLLGLRLLGTLLRLLFLLLGLGLLGALGTRGFLLLSLLIVPLVGLLLPLREHNHGAEQQHDAGADGQLDSFHSLSFARRPPRSLPHRHRHAIRRDAPDTERHHHGIARERAGWNLDIHLVDSYGPRCQSGEAHDSVSAPDRHGRCRGRHRKRVA
jgi:hypothetical protein